MEKKNSIELLLAGALIGGAVYYLFFTERGTRFRERVVDAATDKLDEWLEALEQELAEAEADTADANQGDPA